MKKVKNRHLIFESVFTVINLTKPYVYTFLPKNYTCFGNNRNDVNNYNKFVI